MSEHLEFLRNLQRLLDEGVFVATYKYALLQSLADIAVESTPEPDGSLRVPVADIAEKFIQYYWRQTLPYRGSSQVLYQNSGKQAAIVNYVADSRGAYAGSITAARGDDRRWRGLRRKVSEVIRKMPLWKLQVVAGSTHEFIYRRDDYHDGAILLLPSAVRSFRDLYVIITNFVKGAWVSQIQSFGYNREILGDSAGLSNFLFGSDRESLEKYKQIVKAYQRARCFYCGRDTRRGDLDHFISWSRYPVDLGHNFVYAHAQCNRQKRDFLAHVDHLAKWKEAHLADWQQLATEFGDAGLAHDAVRSEHVAIWAYEQGEASGAHVWIDDKNFSELGPEWRDVFQGQSV